MSDENKQAARPEGEPMTAEQLAQFVKSTFRNTQLEEMGDRFRDDIHRLVRESQGQTGEEAKEARKKRIMAKLFNDSAGRAREVAKGGDWNDGDFSGRPLARAISALAMGGCNREFAIDEAKKMGMDDVVKTLEASTFSAGGALLPEELSADFIGFLYNRTAVRRLGANTVQMPRGGSLNFGKGNVSATAYWVGETEAITKSEPTFKQLRLEAKKLAVLVPISNDLRRQAAPGFENIVRDDMVAKAVEAEDSKFIRGDGSSGTPTGIYNLVASGQKFNANGTVNLANITSDLFKAVFKVEDANIPGDRYGWILNPRTKNYLANLRSADGHLVFHEQIMSGSLLGHPYAMTKNIPRNLDASTDGSDNETEVYFGDFSQLIIGDTLNVEVEMANQASINVAGSTLRAFQEDFSVLRLIHESDMIMRHDTAFSVIEAVDWGAGFGV